MLDTVFVAMFAIIAVMFFSIYLVRVHRKTILHRKIQMVLASVLVVAIVAFEIDVRFITDWRGLAELSPYYASGAVDFWLLFHLCFAIPTPFVWMVVILKAIKHFSTDVSNGTKGESNAGSLGAHAKSHRTWGKIAAGLMTMTAITGCIFYWLAFVA